jgi:transposase
MHPLVKGTWAPRGRTPIYRYRLRHQRHLSVIGAVTISPQRRRLGWHLAFHPDRSVRQDEVLAFLRDLLRHVCGPVVLVWDRLGAHRASRVRAYAKKRGRLDLEYLPPYAPELNPNEYGWAHLKGHALANDCPDDLAELSRHVRRGARRARARPDLLRGFIRATRLPLRL